MDHLEGTTKAVGVAGELWVAATLLLQGIDQGYRVSTVDVDDAGTDLFLFKVKENTVEEVFEIQVKTARKTQKNGRVFFGMQRPLKRGMSNEKRIYIFVYAPRSVEYCWILSEKEINMGYRIKPSVHNISFAITKDTKEKGLPYRCKPDELFDKTILAIKEIKKLANNTSQEKG